jgi:hypothetical protein
MFYQQKSIVLIKFTLSVILSSLLVFTLACGDSDDLEEQLNSDNQTNTNDQETILEQNYNGPGSKWDVELTDNNFRIIRRENIESGINLTVSGTFERLDSGFLKFEVDDATGVDAPEAGDMAWALEVPGYTLFLNPIGEGSQMIPMVSSGECPTEDFSANWVLVKKASDARADEEQRDFFGTFSFTAETGTATLPAKYALQNYTPLEANQSLSGGDCEDGIMQVDDALMYLTSNGGAIVQTGLSEPEDSSFIFALSQKAISDINNLDGDYAGILFDDSLDSGEKIAPISLSCVSGTCSGNIVTNIDDNTLSEEEAATIVLDGTVDDLADGLVVGTIGIGQETGSLACMADVNVLDSGKKMVSCISQSPNDNSKMFNILFVSKDSTD